MQLTSNQPNRDEVDYEFPGNVEGKPYVLQINTGKRGSIYGLIQQRTSIPYYGKPSIKSDQFIADWAPIRVYRNHADKGSISNVAANEHQSLLSLTSSNKASLWNGDSWATRGGCDKIDWSKGPFTASLRNHKIDACVWKGNARFCRAESLTNRWNKERFSALSNAQRRLFKWIRKYHMIYDYCQDKESTLLGCKTASTKKAQAKGKPGPALPLPKSQVGEVRDFLEVISEDNPENYDIDVLTGNESQVVNKELMLGVADLQTPEAVAAAESAIVGCQPESEDSSDDDSSSDDSDDEDSSDDSSSNDNEDEDSDEIKDDTSEKEDKKTSSHARLKTRKSDKDNSLSEDTGINRSQKRPKIVELS
ncbi:xyloglucan endotransglucosylase/hydrolase protein 10 [Pyrus ussuriensis x Pyrus communis]|uniref:Xyloglucan endotransglucosylase/hydrolase n=1 Tax=Pyrus ussuriensis x Pyrus communis TaxID=2448454 RepID=A0A5N5G2B6_9ROSA|nr:xyloglucan endotransglucosylase/hydrolase protein 10 [Pyrus ussuriensis x Pyrus communis]